jgi:hypothetical protein
VRSRGERQHLERQAREGGDLHQALELRPHHLGAADHTPEHRLVQDHPQRARALPGKQRLAALAQVHAALDLVLLQVEADGTEHGTRVVDGLEQARHDQGRVDPYRRGGALHVRRRGEG